MRELLIALLLVVGAAGAPMAVSAQEDGGVLDDFLDSESETDWSETVAGVLKKTQWYATNLDPLSGEEADREKARTDRADLQQAFNANNESIENYTNARFGENASAWNVIEITHVRDDGNATQYLVADVDNGTFHNAMMVNTTDRTVDREMELSGYASDAAHDELDTFATEFAAEDRDVTLAYTSRLATQYSGYAEPPEGLTND